MVKHNAHSARKMVLAAEIDSAELALRIFEGLSGMRRPIGATAAQAMDEIEPVLRASLLQAACNAVTYFRDVINDGRCDVQ